ncbi:MAG: YHS domain-containing protein [Deltaproteobacteria bacterium]|nr:YHS domain-containing protein [Deltaproteobacteria bacterium]
MTAPNITHNFVDPVCHMAVTKSSNVLPFVFQSETYHFCADQCRKVFIADPEKYMKSKPTKRKSLWGRYLDRLNKATGGKPPCCH